MLSQPPKSGPDGHTQLHATTIAIDGKACAITGPAGAGKSALGLALLTRGALLLADDITWLRAMDGSIIASCPPNLLGRIEARGVGILNAAPARPAPLHLIVDLGTPEPDRIPPRRTTALLGHDIAVLHAPATGHFADAIWHYMMHGRAD